MDRIDQPGYRAVTAKTSRGHIQRLPSGLFRVKVYAGTDPVTGKARLLRQTCPDEASDAATLGKLLAQADGDHFPNREATLGQALAKYLEVADLESQPGRRTRATSAAPSGPSSVR